MKNVIAFGASTSKNSINQQLALWAAKQVEGVEVKALDLNDYEAPIYSIDREEEGGIPEPIKAFKKEVTEADAIILSLAEHNGNFTAAFKNVYDWMSRADRSVWDKKPMLLLASSPGPGGGSGVLNIAKGGFPYAGGNIVGSYSLPSFYDNFKGEIENDELLASFNEQLELFKKSL